MDTQGHDSFWSLLNWWDYEKIRMFDAGDRWLFKPLVFIFAGFEKSVFGLSCPLWKILAFSFHLFAVWALFRLLWKIRKGVLATSVALLFASAPLLMNTVLYEQIAPYALFTGLILVALYYVYTNTRWYLVFASLLVACFINEAGIVITILIVTYLFWQKRNKWAITAIIPIYLGVYLSEKLINPAQGLGTEFTRLTSGQTISIGLNGIDAIMERWVRQLFVPSNYSFTPQLNLRAPVALIKDSTSLLPFVFNLVAIFGFIGLIVYSLIKRVTFKGNFPFIILMGAITLVYVAIVSIFRTATHGLPYIFGTNFNAYMFSAWLMVLAFLLTVAIKPHAKVMIGLACCALIVVGISAPKVFSVNYREYVNETPLRNYLVDVNTFVNNHKVEPEFTFQSTMQGDLEKNLDFKLWTLDWSSNPPERINHPYSIPQVLYWQYWSDNPKWILNYSPELNKLAIAINK